MTIGSNVRSAREDLGLTVSELAEQAGVAQEVVERIEADKPGSLAEIEKLSAALRIRLDAALDERAAAAQPLRVLLRSKAAAFTSHDRRMIAEGAALAADRRELEVLLGIPAGKVVELAEPRPPRAPEYEDAEKRAGWARSELRLGDAGIPSMHSLLDDLGVRVLHLRLPPHVDAASLLDDEHGPTVLVNDASEKHKYSTAVRATLAHELAHLLFDVGANKRLSIISMEEDFTPVERRANAFSVYFLAPRAAVGELLNQRGYSAPPAAGLAVADVQHVMRRFGLGYIASLRHLQNLRWITREDVDRLVTAPFQREMDEWARELFPESPTASVLPADLAAVVPPERHMLVDLVLRARRSKLITRARAARALGVPIFRMDEIPWLASGGEAAQVAS